MGSGNSVRKWKVLLSRVIFLSIIQFVFRGFGEYLDEFVAEFHTTLPLASWALTLAGGFSMLVAPIIFRVYRFLSYRHVTVAAGMAFGLLFVTLGMIARKTTHVFIWSVSSGITLGAVGLSTYLELGENFNSNFGMASTTTNVVTGPLAVGFPLLVEYFKVEYGVRWTLILTGAMSWHLVMATHLVMAGICLTTKKMTPTLENSSSQAETTARTVSFLRSHPPIVCYFMFQAVAFIRTLGVSLFLYPFGVSKGLKSTQAALLISVFSLGSLIGRLGALGIFVGKVMERPLVIAAPAIAAPMLVAMTAQILSLDYNNEVLLNIMALTTGISIGFEMSWGSSSVMDFSCKEHFRVTGSWLTFFGGMGATFGGLIIGLTHNIRGSYDDVMILTVLLSGLQGIFVMITLTWKRLVKRCPLQSDSNFRHIDDATSETYQ